MKKLILLTLAMMVVLPAAASAATGMVLTYEYKEPNSYPAPDYCYHEDDYHIRNWQGTLAPGESFTVPLRFCTYTESPTGPSGEGFMYKTEIADRRVSISLRAVFPDGTTTKLAHTTTYPGELWGCVMPAVKPSYRPEGTFVTLIEPGTYQVIVTNTGTRTISTKSPLQETIWVFMGYLNAQQGQCPPEDQNIVVG
jgi:hypothetical protein